MSADERMHLLHTIFQGYCVRCGDEDTEECPCYCDEGYDD